MGVCASFIEKQKQRNKKKIIRLALFGLDNAGKTTIAKTLIGEEADDEEAPTIGFKVYDVESQRKNLLLKLYDVGGGKSIRSIWPNYFAEIHGVVFVMDGTNRKRLKKVKEELYQVIMNPIIIFKPILFLVNKQDKDGCMCLTEIFNELNLPFMTHMTNSSSRMEPCVGRLRENGSVDMNLLIGLDWIVGKVLEKWEFFEEKIEVDMQKCKLEAMRKNHLNKQKRLQRAYSDRLEKTDEKKKDVPDKVTSQGDHVEKKVETPAHENASSHIESPPDFIHADRGETPVSKAQKMPQKPDGEVLDLIDKLKHMSKDVTTFSTSVIPNNKIAPTSN